MDLILTMIFEFYETLSPNLQALETMGKIKEVNGYVRMTLDKMEGIRENLVHTDDNWQDWEFPHLLEALWKWTTRNPPQPADERRGREKTFSSKPLKMKSYQVRQHDQRRRPCVYCESSKHQSVNCDKVMTIHECRKQLNLKQLCFNGTSTKPQGFKMPLFFNLQVSHQGIVVTGIECTANSKGKHSTSHKRPSFRKQQRARRSELSTMCLRELTRKHHPLTIV